MHKHTHTETCLDGLITWPSPQRKHIVSFANVWWSTADNNWLNNLKMVHTKALNGSYQENPHFPLIFQSFEIIILFHNKKTSSYHPKPFWMDGWSIQIQLYSYDWNILCEVWRDISLHSHRLCKPDLTPSDSIWPQQSTFLPQRGEEEILMEEMGQIERQKQRER